MNKAKRKPNNSGFTIIELIIASAVFGVVLLIVSNGAIQIGRLYYRNVTAAKTQEAARAVIDDIAGSIQFSKGSISQTGEDPDTRVLCIGNIRYTFQVNRQIKDSNLHAVWRDSVNDPANPDSDCDADGVEFGEDQASGTGKELLGENMRLLQLSVLGSGNFWTIRTKVAYGDDDLLSHYPPGQTTNNPAEAQCKPSRVVTSTFCSVSALEIGVKRR